MLPHGQLWLMRKQTNSIAEERAYVGKQSGLHLPLAVTPMHVYLQAVCKPRRERRGR
jgi:hypothetical protein